MARPRARKLPAAERSEGIVEAAVKVFAEKGFYGTATREVAEAAGVSEPTVFQYYKTKKELFLAALTAASLPVLMFWQEVCGGPDDPIKKLQALGMRFLEEMLSAPEKPQLLFISLATKGDAEIESFVRGGQDMFHGMAVGILNDGIAQGIFRKNIDVSNEAWRFLGIGAAICMLAVLGKTEELHSQNIWRWGDAFRDSILVREFE